MSINYQFEIINFLTKIKDQNRTIQPRRIMYELFNIKMSNTSNLKMAKQKNKADLERNVKDLEFKFLDKLAQS